MPEQLLPRSTTPGEDRHSDSHPLISVIVATYNYGNFIRKAIDSVLAQTYPRVELIIVDDGSTDDTAAIVSQYRDIKYVHQANGGVSAARNRGIALAGGEFVCFLDADDWLEPDGLRCNYSAVSQDPHLAFVSGNYRLIDAETGNTTEVIAPIPESPYCALLESNYIGMLATVLFRRSVLETDPFDEQVRACEDYELFLRIARKCPVVHHSGFIATYFHHRGSLSHKYALMVDSLRLVMARQEPLLQNENERSAFDRGMLQWRDYQDLAETEETGGLP